VPEAVVAVVCLIQVVHKLVLVAVTMDKLVLVVVEEAVAVAVRKLQQVQAG
jgi:hypothetical protein